MKTYQYLFALILPALTLVNSCKQPDMAVNTSIEVPVGVIEAEISFIEEFINTTGTVYPVKEVNMNSEMSGLYRLQVNPQTGKPYALGDNVAMGASIIRLEDEEYVNNQRVKSREVNYEISKQEFEKQQSLYEKGGATLRELKNAEIGLINSQYDIESSRINIEKMSINAPFSGVISDLPYFTNGTKVNTNTLMVKIIDYSMLYLETNLPEKYYSNVDKGFKVYITGYTNPLDTLMGELTQISPSIDPEARTFKCFVNVDNQMNKILPGMFVKADLVINSSDNTIVIPKDIIITRNRIRTVFVIERGVAHERVINTGLESIEMVEVLSGLESGESVVSRGFETLRENSQVKVLR